MPDPYEKLRLSSPPPKIMARAQSRFDSIQELVSDPRLYDPLTRRAAFRDASGGDKKLLINPIFALLLAHNAPRTCFRFKDPLGLPGFLFATALSISTF